jgi:hypothetical protein
MQNSAKRYIHAKWVPQWRHRRSLNISPTSAYYNELVRVWQLLQLWYPMCIGWLWGGQENQPCSKHWNWWYVCTLVFYTKVWDTASTVQQCTLAPSTGTKTCVDDKPNNRQKPVLTFRGMTATEEDSPVLWQAHTSLMKWVKEIYNRKWSKVGLLVLKSRALLQCI